MGIFEKKLSSIIKIQYLMILPTVYLLFDSDPMRGVLPVEYIAVVYILVFVFNIAFVSLFLLKKNWFRLIWIASYFISYPVGLLLNDDNTETPLTSFTFETILLIILFILNSWCTYLLCTAPVKLEFKSKKQSSCDH